MRLGQLLLSLGLIHQQDLDRALAAQAKSGEALGPILSSHQSVAQAEIDAAWIGHVGFPALEHRLCELSGGSFTQRDDRHLRFTRLGRQLTQAGGHWHTVVEGWVDVSLGSTVLPIRFAFDIESSEVLVDGETAQAFVDWCDLLTAPSRPRAKLMNGDTPAPINVGLKPPQARSAPGWSVAPQWSIPDQVVDWSKAA
jgi:hypothetical protein